MAAPVAIGVVTVHADCGLQTLRQREIDAYFQHRFGIMAQSSSLFVRQKSVGHVIVHSADQTLYSSATR